jgi:hypothetical protein
MAMLYLCVIVNDLVTKAPHGFVELPVVLREGLKPNSGKGPWQLTSV